MKKYLSALLFILLSFLNGCNNEDYISPSDNLTNVPVMNIYIENEEYLFFLKNRAFNAEAHCQINYKGKLYKAEIRSSGAGSRYYPKWSYKVELEDDLIEGYDEFNLSAQVSDPTLLATAIASDQYKRVGFPVFKTQFVFLKINGEDKGLYPLIERVEEEFFADRNLDVAVLFKVGFESKFSLKGNYNPIFHFEKKIPDNENFADLNEFLHAVDTASTNKLDNSLGKFLNLENYIKYHAMTTLLNNTDAFSNNFFLWKRSVDAPFEIIPWDFDKALFKESEINSIYAYNEIIGRIASNKTLHSKYLEEIEYQLENVFTLENIKQIAESTEAIIEDAYYLDPYLGYGGRFNFEEEKNKMYDFVEKRITKMKDLLNAEKSKLQ